MASHVTESDIITLRNGLAPIFNELGIDLVIQGHDHVYARSYIMGGESGMDAQITDETAQGDRDMTTGTPEFTDPDGVMYVTFNSGSGSKNYKITNEAFPYTDVQFQNNGRSYSHLSVNGGDLTVTTYNLENNTITDTFTIHKTIAADSVTLDQNKLSLEAGDTDSRALRVTPDAVTDPTITWASSNEDVATVNENGVVTAVSAGTATITATAANGVSAACDVTVTWPVVFNPSNLVMNIGNDESQVIFVWYNQTATADTMVFDGQHYHAATEPASQDGYTINRVVINNLKPNTDYTYYIENGDNTTQAYSYSTGDFTSNALDIAVVGDPQIGSSGNNESDTNGWNETLDTITADGNRTTTSCSPWATRSTPTTTEKTEIKWKLSTTGSCPATNSPACLWQPWWATTTTATTPLCTPITSLIPMSPPTAKAWAPATGTTTSPTTMCCSWC